MTLGHNIVADRWAGASNPEPHPDSHPTHMHTRKVSKTLIFPLFDSIITDGPTDRRTQVSTDEQNNGPTDRRKDKASYRVACPQLKRREHRQIGYKHRNGGWNHTQASYAEVKPVYRLTSMIDFSFPTFSAFLYFILLLLTAYRKAGGSINDIGMQWT